MASHVCPITQEPFRDPVVAADGHTYEREAILKWFQTRKPCTSPVTNLVLDDTTLRANIALRPPDFSSGSLPSSELVVAIKYVDAASFENTAELEAAALVLSEHKGRAPKINLIAVLALAFFVYTGSRSWGSSTVVAVLRVVRYAVPQGTMFLVDRGILRALVDVSRAWSFDRDVTYEACLAFNNFTGRSFLAQMARAGVHDVVAGALRNFQNDSDIVRCACTIVMRMAYDDDVEVQLFTAGVASAVIAATRHHLDNLNVAREANGAIRNLSAAWQNRPTMLELGAADLAVRYIKPESDSILLERSINVLLNLAQHPRNRADLRDIGADEALRKLIQAGVASNIQRDAETAISRINATCFFW